MYFTQEDYKKIENWLHRNSVKDTEFQEALPFTGKEIVTVVQDGHNRKVNIQEFINQLYKHGVEDFLNVTNTYRANNITLKEAIRLIPAEARKEGQVITFLNTDGNWEIYQFIGKLNQWNNPTLWNNPFDWEKFVVDSILPDEEDLTKSAPDAKGNSYLSLKDRKYEPDKYSGLGRKILRRRVVEIEDPIYGTQEKNLLLQADFDEENTIYEIRYDFDLNGAEITIPENCVLEFDGGSIFGGHTITGQNTSIKAGLVKIFNTDVTLAGTFKNGEWNAEWFGVNSTSLNNDVYINHAIEQLYNINGGTLLINHNCTISDTIYLMNGVSIVGTSQSRNASTYWPEGGTNIKCAFSNKNKWMMSNRVESTTLHTEIELNEKTTFKLEGIRIENILFRPVFPDGSDILQKNTEAIFGGIRISMFINSSMKNVTVYGAKYGISVTKSWCSTFDNVFSFSTALGLYCGSVDTVLHFANCRFRNSKSNFTGGNPNFDFTLFPNGKSELVPPYLNISDIKSYGIICLSQKGIQGPSCNFNTLTIEDFDIGMYLNTGRFTITHFYTESIKETLIYAKLCSVLVQNQGYNLFKNVPILENGYEFGCDSGSMQIQGSFACARCYPGTGVYIVTVTDKYYTNYYDTIQRNNNILTYNKTPNKTFVGIGNKLYVDNDNSSQYPPSESDITICNALRLGNSIFNSISLNEVSERLANLIEDKNIDVYVKATSYIGSTGPTVEDKNIKVHDIRTSSDNVFYVNNNFKIKNSCIDVSEFIEGVRTSGGDNNMFGVYGKCSIKLVKPYYSTYYICKLLGEGPIELDIFITDSAYTDTYNKYIQNPSFEYPYTVRVHKGDDVKTLTNIARPTKGVPIGYVYIENGVPIYYTGDTSGSNTGWVDATGATV